MISGESVWEGDLGLLVELLSFVVVTGVTGEPCMGSLLSKKNPTVQSH